MSWTITIDRLAASGIIGVHPWEREQEQTLYITVQLTADVQAGAEHDDLSLTIDYSDVAQRVRHLVATAKAQLIEHLAWRLADSLSQAYSLAEVEVRIDKPNAVDAAHNTSVTYRRG